MVAFLHLLALSGYLGAWGALYRAFREGGAELAATGWKVGVGSAGVHGLALGLFAAQTGSLPLVGLGPASSSLALLVAVLVLAAAVREEIRPTALFVLPVSMLLLVEAIAVDVRPVAQETAFRGVWFVAHVSTSFLGYAALALASAAAAMYVLQFRSLKKKEFGSVFRFFPSLDTLDRVHRVGLEVGFSALTLGLVAGWSWTLTYGRGLILDNPQVVFGIVTWVAYLTAILVRLAPGGRGHRSAAASAAAFLVTAVAFGALRIMHESAGLFL